MAYYYSLRGWLEVEPENFSHTIEMLKSLQKQYEADPKLSLYLKGWCWNEANEGLKFFKSMLSLIAKSGLKLSGYFHAQGEDGEKNYLYKMTDDCVQLEKSLHRLEIS